MEEQWQVDRARLRELRQQHPEWGKRELAQQIGRSLSWVKKWCKRLAAATSDDQKVLKSRSRRPKRSGSPIEQAVIQRILAIRDEPPGGLRRIPGPAAIKYYLHQQEQQEPLGCYLPTSTSTIWAILAKHQRIFRPGPIEKEPTEPTLPLEVWQMDFKDVTTVKPEPQVKKQHLVETLNIIDTGTSILIDNPARQDFNAETVIRTLAQVFVQHGCPKQLTFDRDPRFVASASSGDFPAPFVRFLACLGIKADICPPQRPDMNGFVERYNRTYKYEGILAYLPDSFQQVLDMNLDVRYHYNYQRPNQARSCANQPPRLAFPDLPDLPPPAEIIDPDRWLQTIDGKLFKRRVSKAGTIMVDKQRYYIGRPHHGRLVLLRVDASHKQFVVELLGQSLKTLPIKGLYHASLSFAAYLDFICQQAVSAWRHYLRTHTHYSPFGP